MNIATNDHRARSDFVPETSPDDPEAHRPHVRSVVDGIRALAGVVLIFAGLGITHVFDSTLLGLAIDTTTASERLPAWSHDLAATLLASAVVTGTFVVAVRALLTTRFRRFALYTVAIAAAAGVSIVLGRFADGLVDEATRASLAVDVPLFRVTGANGRLNPADPLLAASIATVTIASSFLSTRITRRASAVLATYAVVSVSTVGAAPLALSTDVGAGLLTGSLLLWTFGRHDLALLPSEIRTALSNAGCATTQLEPRSSTDRTRHGGAARGTVWVADDPDGGAMIVTASSRDDRSSALLVRAIRWLRFRRTGDHRPFLSLRRSVEHEALVGLAARARGVRTPTIRAVAPAGVDGMVIARDCVAGEATTEPSQAEPSDVLLRSTWRQAGRLVETRLAHGRLRLSSVIADDQHRAWLVGFERGELAASPQRTGTDLAELLASTAGAIGIADAVRLAHETVGPDVLQGCIPWLQPLALTSDTRAAIGGKDQIGELRTATAEACDVEPDEPVRLERVDTKTLFVLGTIVLSGWFLLPQLADLDSIWSQVRDASVRWALVAVLFSVGTYVAATASLLGAIPVRLAFVPALTAQVASSFANRVTPAKVGGLATNLRYFQRKGVPAAVGATAVGLNTIAGVIVHLALTLVALLLAGGAGEAGGVSVPSAGVVALVVVAMTATSILAAAVPSMRRLMVTRVLPQVKIGWNTLVVIIRDPGRLLMLFGGATMITLCYLAAMVASLRAFGSAAPVPLVGLFFLTGSAVANAAPTPGGLGAAEAALIAALSTIESTAIVVPAVFLYRLVTFWLPIVPGWIAINHLRRHDSL